MDFFQPRVDEGLDFFQSTQEENLELFQPRDDTMDKSSFKEDTIVIPFEMLDVNMMPVHDC